MLTTKRQRGRPRGSGKNDMPDLSRVADLMVRDASLKPTTAGDRLMILPSYLGPVINLGIPGEGFA